MIKTRNLGEIIIRLRVPGVQAVTAAADTYGQSGGIAILPFAARLKAVFARVGAAGTTGTQTTDVLKNQTAPATGTSLLASGALITFASGSQAPTYASNFVTNPPLFNKGDFVSLNTTVVHTTPAKDLEVVLVFERQRAGSWNDAVQTDTIGADSDAIG